MASPPSPPDYTFRDAGLHSRPLQALNWVGERLVRAGVSQAQASFDPGSIVAAARKQAGSRELGDDTWSEPLRVLCESIEGEAKLSPFGRIALRGMLVGALANRIRLLDWAERHPEVRQEKIERPWIILGMPRTGTSLLSILMGLDPSSRSLLTWQAMEPVPPPELATEAEDPRIAVARKRFEGLMKLNPALRAMHPFGATLATECVTLLVFDLRSLSIETQALLPSYGEWLESADMHSAYGWHELALQTLQSRIPTLSWVLKTPQHLWAIDAVTKRYPDARLIWTHRDPRKVVTSVASLNTSLHRQGSDAVDPAAVGRAWSAKLRHAIECGMRYDDAHSGESWCCHVQYADIMADPIGAVRSIYAHFGEELHPLHEKRMDVWMRDRPQEVFGRHRYDPRDFGLSNEGIREQYADYCERYEVPAEGS